MSSEAPITISVTDPTKCTDKISQYISYKIHSNTTRPGFESGAHSVVRRYSDFTWLVQELSREFPGAIVPPLPEKLAVGRFQEEFVESRRRALEKFLQRTAENPELGNSQYFIVFLQAGEAGLKEAMGESKAIAKSKAPTAVSWFETSVNNLTVANKPELEKSAADIKTEEISQYVTALEKQIVSVSRHADNLVKRSREMCLSLYEFGQSATFLGQTETDSLGTALQALGNTSDTVSCSVHQFAESKVVQLVEPLEEYSRMLQSIKFAIQQRGAKKTAYVNSLVDVEAKTAAYRKVLGVPGKEPQVEVKEAAVAAAQDIADAAKAEFEKTSERLLTEFELFKNQKAIDIKTIVTNFLTLQIEFNKQCEETWNKLTPAIERIETSEANYIRETSQARSASDSRVPDHNFTIGRSGNSTSGGSPRQDSSPSANPFGSSNSSYPPPPSYSPSAPSTAAPDSNPFGDDEVAPSAAARKHSAFTDDEGVGGEDDEVEEV